MKHPLFYTSLSLAIILFLVVSVYVFGWTAPTANPPSSNLPAPINTGSDKQPKSGFLAVGTTTTPEYPLDVAGVLRVGSFSSAPTGKNGAIYYDTTVGKFKGFQGGNWDVIGGANPSGSTGYIQFASSTQFGSDSKLFWDNTNKRLGVGTTTPQGALDVTGNIIARTSTSTVTIQGDGSISLNLNADKLDGYNASDLLASSVGYINWADCTVSNKCVGNNESFTLSCPSNYQLIASTCSFMYSGAAAQDTPKCYLTDVNSLYIAGMSSYSKCCGSIKCCKYIAP